jgi:hypothetical protein
MLVQEFYELLKDMADQRMSLSAYGDYVSHKTREE